MKSMNFSRIKKLALASGIGLAAIVATSSVSAQTYDIQSANATGSNANFPPSNAIDGVLTNSSRWSGRSPNTSTPTEIRLDLGQNRTVDDVRIAWTGNNSSTYTFEIAGRTGTSGSWTTVLTGTANGSNNAFVNYNVPDINARQVRIRGARDGSFTNITEVEIIGPSGPSSSSSSSSSGSGSTTGIFNFRKQNFQFSIDGNNGAQVGEQIYLWNTNFGNVNQQWVEIDRGNNFYSYQKRNTNVCIDGGNGGQRGQAVIIFPCNANNQNQHWRKFNTSGGTVRLQKRNASGFSIDGQGGAQRLQELHLWTSNNNNANQRWIMANINDSSSSSSSSSSGGSSSSGSSSGGGDPQFGLSPNLQPWENFDLSRWALDSPEGRSSNECQSRRIDEDEWDDIPGTDTEDYFFTHSDGGMRFVSPVGGATTNSSCNSGFPRSELREMLRSNTSISTTSIPNNWALGYQPGNNTDHAGRNGVLTATLRVNRVTTTGDGLHPGRTIIGQIHAQDDEPARLYYRKLPNADRGCIYLEHEIRNGSDRTFNMIGNEQCSGNGPSNGIELNELFSYEIINEGAEIIVRIRRGDSNGPILAQTTVDMNDEDSGYDISSEWMYFKAGAYTQNNTGNDNDRDIITFYRLSNTHDAN